MIIEYTKARSSALSAAIHDVIELVSVETGSMSAQVSEQILEPLSTSMRQDVLEESLARIRQEATQCRDLSELLRKQESTGPGESSEALRQLEEMEHQRHERLDKLWDLL